MKNKKNILITGGAGFIGSNLVGHFLNHPDVNIVRVLDNLSNGYIENIEEYFTNPRFEFIEGDIRNYKTCMKACKNIDKISHQAALGSVPRSIEDPILSSEVNIMGTINVLHAAFKNNIERVVLAFSSSTYGDHPDLPKKEEITGNPMSPYAVTKASCEQFADVFNKSYNLNYIGLRYFNVFGHKQNPNNPYAAVIPKFINAALNNDVITIYGDGLTTRDFTYITNVVHANECALFSEKVSGLNQVYNVACGAQISLNSLVEEIKNNIKKNISVKYYKEREGDVKHSFADITKIKRIGYSVKTEFIDGLSMFIDYLKKQTI